MRAPYANATGLERRQYHRYQLSAPVSFCWALPDEPLHSGKGMTRDIDTTGAYITAGELPPIGARVHLDILLPNPSDARPGAHLIGEGVVLRIGPHDRKALDGWGRGFAVSVHFYLETSESVLAHLKAAEGVM